MARVARAAAAPRAVVVIAEHEPQDATLLRPPQDGGYGLDGMFNEDYHHSMRVALTGVRDAYLSDYSGASREWLAAVQAGFPWQSASRGTPALDRHSSGRPAFEACVLDDTRLPDDDPHWRMHRDLLALRRDDTSLGQHAVDPHGQNTVHIRYRLAGTSQAIRLRIRPWLDFREHEGVLSP